MNKKRDISLIIIFIFIIAIFTLVNLGEFITGSESDGRRLGLGQLRSGRDQAVALWGVGQRLMGKELTFGSTDYENVVSLGDGYYTMPDPDPSIAAGQRGTLRGMELALDMDIPFLYVLAPPKQEKADEDAGVVDYAVAKYEAFSQWLVDNQVPALDYGQIFSSSEDDYKSFFYKTDHHPNNKATFMMYQGICKWMGEQGFEINEEYTKLDAYDVVHYDDVFLGSSGRMTGPLYTGLDDYDLYIPRFDTDYTLQTPSQGICQRGDFEQALVYYDNLAGYSYDYYAYYAYLHEDYDFTSIINHNNPDGAHLVILRDSSAVPISCFLISQCSQIDLISLRYVEDKSYVEEYIRNQEPDAIIYIFGVGFLGNEGTFIY